MAKQKEILKPSELYKQIQKALEVARISTNPFNVKLVVKELTDGFVSSNFTDDVIQYQDIEYSVQKLKSPNAFYSDLAFALARKNQKQLKDVESYLKQELKESPEEN